MSALRIRLIGVLPALILLTACAGNTDAPVRAVEDYIDALAAHDADRLALLSCAEWENDALTTLDSFAAVEVTPVDVSCEAHDVQADSARVTCSGALAVSYEGEIRQFDLANQDFQMVRQSGSWLVCEVQQSDVQ
jgi:hypothetical protein